VHDGAAGLAVRVGGDQVEIVLTVRELCGVESREGARVDRRRAAGEFVPLALAGRRFRSGIARKYTRGGHLISPPSVASPSTT